jgi:hypothetical protein
MWQLRPRFHEIVTTPFRRTECLAAGAPPSMPSLRRPPVSCARFQGVIDSRVKRFLAALVAVLSSAVLLAPFAIAGDGGVGTAGRITDKYITFFCFGVIAFFALFVTVMSLIQGRLDAKKERRRHDLDRFNS